MAHGHLQIHWSLCLDRLRKHQVMQREIDLQQNPPYKLALLFLFRQNRHHRHPKWMGQQLRLLMWFHRHPPLRLDLIALHHRQCRQQSHHWLQPCLLWLQTHYLQNQQVQHRHHHQS